MKIPPRFLRLILAVTLSAGMLAGVQATSVTPASATTTPTLDLKVLLIGDGASDATTAAWASALNNEGVPYTEVDADAAPWGAGR